MNTNLAMLIITLMFIIGLINPLAIIYIWLGVMTLDLLAKPQIELMDFITEVQTTKARKLM